jgi:hypothetical protein
MSVKLSTLQSELYTGFRDSISEADLEQIDILLEEAYRAGEEEACQQQLDFEYDRGYKSGWDDSKDAVERAEDCLIKIAEEKAFQRLLAISEKI